MLTEEQKQKLRNAGYSDSKISAYEATKAQKSGFFNNTAVGSKLKELGTNLVEAVKDPLTVIPQRIQDVTPTARETSILAGTVKDQTPEETAMAKDKVLNFALSVDGGNAGKKIGEIAKESFNDAIASRPNLVDVGNVKQKISNFFSNDIDEKAATILKETPTSKLDEYVQVAKEAVTDPRKLTPFEVVGDKMAEATKQLQGQVKSLSQQKKQIISKAKTGLTDFTKETSELILDINRNLKDSKIGQTVISKLKQVKNKLQADNAIDEIQDMLYKGNQDLTIPKGSSEDKALRGLLGKYNSALKAGLPQAYSTLNTKISNRIKVVDSLNRALGEVVDGVSTRGAGLIKQFFSPTGRKVKEIFEYVKKETGIDLSQDATLARFTMELFDDARAKSLLEGVSPSPSGLLQKGLNLLVDKTGIGSNLQKKVRENTIEKAKGLTK